MPRTKLILLHVSQLLVYFSVEVKPSIYLTITEGGVCSLENNADDQVSGEGGVGTFMLIPDTQSPEALAKECALFGTPGVAFSFRFCLCDTKAGPFYEYQ